VETTTQARFASLQPKSRELLSAFVAKPFGSDDPTWPKVLQIVEYVLEAKLPSDIPGALVMFISYQITVGNTLWPLRLACIRGEVSFATCIQQALKTPEYIANYDRLRGSNLSLRGSGLDLAIDQATGRINHDLEGLLEFCWEYLFLRFESPDHVPILQAPATS
jgi:hypothetical protein